MHSSTSMRLAAFVAVSGLVACGGGGGGGNNTGPGPAASINLNVSAVSFGAIGSTSQLSATYKDANGVAVSGPSPTFARAGTGTTASVSASGLVTALAAGATDTAVVSGGGFTARAPISVSQVAALVTVSGPGATPDTLFAATRTRQFTAVAKDSNNNALAVAPVFAWTSATPAVATVNAATGLVTALTDGTANIQAAAGTGTGSRPIVVRRLAATHSLTPTTGTIAVAGGTTGPFNGIASDSAGQSIALGWVSRNTGVFTTSSSTASSTSVTAVGNGSAQLVMTVPSVGAIDSAAITVSNQPVIPSIATVTVGDDFFKSAHNATQGGALPGAVDTVGVNGTVTWNFTGAVQHSVQSTGSPTFVSSGLQQTGSFSRQFTVAGTYTYNCVVHGNAMTGTVVVR